MFWEASRGPQAVLPDKNVHTQYATGEASGEHDDSMVQREG